MQDKLAEALRRIEEARKTQEESLDLQGTGIADISILAGLTALKSLDLRDTEVTDLSPLAGLTALQSLDLGDTGVRDLSPLAGLTALQSLKLGPTGVRDFSPLAGLTALQNLELWDTKVTDLSILGGLTALQSLNLGATGVTDLSPLAGLTALQNLELWATKVTDLSILGGLAALQSLDLEHTSVTDISPLARLSALRSLKLGATGVTDLSPLAGLTALQNLELWDTEVTDLSPLAGLTALQELDLKRTGATDLSPLAELTALQNLELWDTEVTDLSPLAGLTALQVLDLELTGVTELSPLARLTALRILALKASGVTDLSPLVGLTALQELDLKRTDVTDISPLAGLTALQKLNLEHTGVTDLSPLAGLTALQSLLLMNTPLPAAALRSITDHLSHTSVSANEAVGIPKEILSKNRDDDCLPRLRTYFSELDLGAEADNEVKVILLGNGGVGKTQLCRRFRNLPYDEGVPSTHGVQIWREELRFQFEGQDRVSHGNWWDFGGQDIYHGTHALFLRSRAVFLILWTPDLENRDESDESSPPIRNQPIAYWLDYVRTLAGQGNPVVVVQSKCDQFADRRQPPQRPKGFEFFECCAYSAIENLGRETLDAQLRDAIRFLLERNGPHEIGRGRAVIRRRLYAWRSEDQKKDPAARIHRTLTVEEFRALCEEVEGIVSWEHALDFFHHSGVVFYRPDLFSGRIILDQNWALEAVYAVFHRGQAMPWLRDSGRFTLEDLAATVWREHSPEERELFLDLMESCGVCFRCGETSRGEVRYVAPDLLPNFLSVSDRLHAWREKLCVTSLRLKYRFFHPAIIRKLMSDIGRRAGDFAEFWKYGFWFKDGQRDSQILVQFEDTSMDKTPGAGALELKAQGRNPLGLLREIRQAILWRRFVEGPEELLTLEGTTVARSALANVVDGRVLDCRRKPVSAARFSAFFKDQEFFGEARAPKENAAIEVDPQPLTPRDKKVREVFISYAWGDETPKGKVRTKVVDELFSALEKHGFLPVRDRDQIRPGERISAFIRRLTRADLVVAVVSDKYLRSPHCMYEIFSLWQRCQGDAGELVDRVVPIVLPGVKIGSALERAPYVKFWLAKAKELAKLHKDLGLLLSSESVQEARLVRQFAEDVDGILVFVQDILMPRRLEAHLDNGFEAVQEALRRRIERLKGRAA